VQVTLNGSLAYSKEAPWSYDSWSIGIIFLELLLGTPHVFTVDQVGYLRHPQKDRSSYRMYTK
jgi:hypothetical protein